ncbi:hypothetical protein [Pseudomonas sp. 008]|uniref:hypothetical protein n=1 Tax=Pseudomonas sp. 008 TaxID=2803906 RepID=UPI001EF2B4B3|nr:hypothetical protein [Pseudomonas sp. 008]
MTAVQGIDGNRNIGDHFLQQEIHLPLLLAVARQLAGNVIDLLNDALKSPRPVGHPTQTEIFLLYRFQQIGYDVDFINQLLKKVIAEINHRYTQNKQGEKLKVNGLVRKNPKQQVRNN